jgi:biopolymer transport protein ExbD
MAMMTGVSGRAKAEINMTPMIDVLLVLIILFMVITPITPRGLETALPHMENTQRNASSDPLVLCVRGDGSLEIGGEQVEWVRLPGRLNELLRISPDRVVFVRGERGVDFQPVALAVDAAKGAGASRIGLMQ